MVYTLNPQDDPRWPVFVRQHPQSSVFHTPEWLEAVKQTYGYESVVLTTSAPNNELTNGVVLCRINSWLTGRRMVSVPFADHCEPLIDAPADRRAIVDELSRVVERRTCKYVELRPLSDEFAEQPRLFSGQSFCFHVLDLRPSEDELFKRLHKTSTQNKVRRAEREGLQYVEGRSPLLLQQFYDLMLLTRRRHKLPPQPITWFENLAECMGDRLAFCVATSRDRPVAAMLTLRHERTLTYKYGASDAELHSLGGMPFLFWNVIRRAKDAGVTALDLGRSDADNAGLITFKDRLGAARSTVTYVRCSAAGNRSARQGYGMVLAKGLFARLPDSLLTTAGRLLYRHIG
jgi:lipid II:glycine glycyltransferase (peptidoglycan interpeptide bridge formation enzyme)